MLLRDFVKHQDAFLFENRLFKNVVLILALTILALTYIIFAKIEDQKVVILPPVQEVREFWVQGNMVSTSYLEMMGEMIATNFLNVTLERPINIDLIMTLVPAEHFHQVRSSILAQGKYLQDNSITQVFYPIKHEVFKGTLKVRGILKQFIGEKNIESSLHTLTIAYKIDQGRFWLVGVTLSKEGEREE